ncbi:metallophosphoesterase family protein [Ralstonia solanacearum]|uniref:metallophosphoesterase family protein n=1 Tax=Ralstonia solanacearum TaxID=305 RepID=UPI000181741B|nr:metallophosphoesterase [Ralstonia solanacearum]MDC6178920.1 metallophosphoesterase [Ralstonia solanacearum]MDC6211667.1 metallophosphoesterase [Ralstonia solanacearum]MDC6240420.1 metallophosphoesterase [Ralstonia solanacearum]MDD7802143.1 metallophosphoesterase [Ralstonia solanacearum]
MEIRSMFSPVRRVRTVCTMATFAALTAAAVIAGCGGASSDASLRTAMPADAATANANIQAAWVEIGDGNQTVVRAVTRYAGSTAPADSTVCPLLTVDGATTRMSLRVAAGTVPQRSTASAASDSKASAFPVSACEATVPAGAQAASIGSRVLPLPKANPQRVVILADTGCRLKKSSNTFQACLDATQWPFATAAATAAAMNPDLVLHVGDYHYRENACPSDIAGCRGSPWGYGWDTWQADLFEPAAPLLAAAPWVVVRGNHEECTRAGQGWFRFLDPRAYSAARSCDDPANDTAANASDPYAVAIGADTQVIVFDSAKAGTTALATTDPWFQTYQKQFGTVGTLAARPGMMSIFTNHHPILAFVPVAGGTPLGGNAALLSVMNSLNATAYYPPGVQVALHGHVHDFQAINFSSNHPATIVAGNAGDTLDVALPDPFPSISPASGVTVGSISHNNAFGFMVMERQPAPATGWLFKAYTVAGKLLTTCTQDGTSLSCDKTGFVAP